LEVELDWLLKVRLVVARHGEQDVARWWNSTGQLGSRGAGVLARGFPRTHYFAQARSVFAAAEARCSETFGLKGAHTLWRLDDEIEEAFEQRWETWLDDSGSWVAFFEGLAGPADDDVRTALIARNLVSDLQGGAIDALPIDPSGQSVRVGDKVSSKDALALLALGFSKGAPGKLVVPYVSATQ
jgi:hypothetical protein